ncbi:ABC transporter-related protein [Chthoniobacter flavus Ellin428]|uniref:ABC transporter-related protein n=1 Tax=Chthoniobacter flavus Ellin428 TaxID=497964 RepID=B4CUB0_9BACT|nr:sugar ABC transporter ATP-binding protein [Chthoniobacter flavus]EDY22148.1 ABC transporter-related protein [Chthoniobacter flavus Ellin428]TCO94819.1 monosaccharide ABC transporter ATP-binding protein (CUT2 family) [Chthoniobacter flavus]
MNAEPSPPVTLLEFRDIAKSFGGVWALSGVSFDLRAGEIHALLGVNGAGKSTLIKTLAGIHTPDVGEIWMDGRCTPISSPADAMRLGVRVIHQELSLAPNLSVAENLFLGREPVRLGLLDRRAMERAAASLMRSLGFDELADVTVRVETLPMALRQLVEIARALSAAARILVLDEPTTSLTAAESAALFRKLEALRAQGVGIIYISHRLGEISRLADRITVLRDGRSIGTQDAAHLDAAALVKWMAGRAVAEVAQRPAMAAAGGVVLRAVHLRNARVRDVSFELREGEVLGLAGLVGAGRTELARALFGVDALEAGEIEIGGRALPHPSPAAALAAGLVLVPEDRELEGLIMDQSVAFNAALPWTARWLRRGSLDHALRRAIVQRALSAFAVKCANADAAVSTLSGGNQQKVLVGRWLESRPRVLILDEPTRGVDVGARADLFGVVRALVEQGMAVLLISSDLDEVLDFSHRIAVYREGRIRRTGAARDFDQETLLAELTATA